MSTDGRLGQLWRVHRMEYNSATKGSADTRRAVREPRKHDATWGKPETESHTYGMIPFTGTIQTR